METKTYRVKNMHEAVELVRAELGPAASILHARRVDNRWSSLFGREPVLEVVASPDADVPSRFPSQESITNPVNIDASSNDSRDDHEPVDQEPVDQEPGDHSEAESKRSLSGDMDFELSHERNERDRTYRDWLLGAEFPNDALNWLAERIDPYSRSSSQVSSRPEPKGNRSHQWIDRPAAIEETQSALEPHIRIAGRLLDRPPKDGPLVVAFVGPTGVGKTTTLAKIAAEFHVRRNQSVGLITIDTYRIAAVDQLRMYADIIDVPMEVVTDALEMRESCERLQDCDLILIDTSGQSPKDNERMNELTSILNEARPDEVLLVLSCMASASGFRRAIESFMATSPNSIVLSKIDESDGLGHLWMPLLECQLPIRYLTTGQDVPDDIELADERSVSAAILNREANDSFNQTMRESHA